MKITLRSISFLFVGLLIISSCSKEKTGESLKQIADKIELNQDEELEDTTSNDLIEFEVPEIEEPVPPLLPPSPPGPEPLPPAPWPDPYPEPIDPPIYPNPERPLPPPVPNPVVDFPDTEPVYPGDSPQDMKHMMKFISENIRYPQIDVENGNQGRVYLEFIVEKDGSLTNVKVLRGVSESIDKEAKRVVSLMPSWIPGKSGGKIVRARARLPITFSLN